MDLKFRVMGFFQITLLVIIVLVGLSIYPLITIGGLLIGLGFETGNVIWSRIGIGLIFLVIFIRVWIYINNVEKFKNN